MKRRKSSPLKTLLYISLTLVASVLGFFLWEAWTESQERLAVLKRDEKEHEKNVADLERQKDQNAAYLDRIQDREFLMREARERLGIVTSSGEVVIQIDPPRHY